MVNIARGGGLDNQAKTLAMGLCQPVQGIEVRVQVGEGASTTQSKPHSGVGPKLWLAAVPRVSLIQMGQR